MRIALLVPCYIDQLKPEIGLAALDVLEAFGFEIEVPEAQTCCGQPFLNAGEARRATALFQHTLDVFDDADEIVVLSGSCAATLRTQLPRHLSGQRAANFAGRTREFCEFLMAHDVDTSLLGPFPFRVGLHASCHALRELRLGTPTESRGPEQADPAHALLTSIGELQLVDLTRRDECCGFGGLFSVEEEAVSCQMGLDRLADHQNAGAEVIVSSDASCLLQLDGLTRRSRTPLRTMHVAEVLAESLSKSVDVTRQSTSLPDTTLDRVHGTR